MSIRERFLEGKKQKKKWVMLTAYDAPTAELLERSGIDMILVGDSLGMVLLGYSSTADVTMDQMIHHAKAVRRGAPRSFLIGDLPLKGVQKGPGQALESARRFIEEAGLDAVKLEWSDEATRITERLVRNRIPVMGHVGLTPQTVARKSAYRVRGRDAEDALKILKNAKAFENYGVFSVLLECVPSIIAKSVTENLNVPTIGIGAGSFCDGQVLVFQDLVGIFTKFKPKFVERYAELYGPMEKAVRRFKRDVMAGQFPRTRHSFSMNRGEKELFLKGIR